MRNKKRDLQKKQDHSSIEDHKRSTLEFSGSQKQKKSQKQLTFSFGSLKKIDFYQDNSCEEILFICSTCGAKNQLSAEMALVSKKSIRKLKQEANEIRQDQRKMEKEIQIFFSVFLRENFQLIEQNISKEVQKRVNEIMKQKRTFFLVEQNISKFDEQMKVSENFIQQNYYSNKKIQCPDNFQSQTGKIRQIKGKSANKNVQAAQKELQSLAYGSQQLAPKNLNLASRFENKMPNPNSRLQSARLKDQRQGQKRKNDSQQVFLDRIKSLDNLKERISKLKKEIIGKKK